MTEPSVAVVIPTLDRPALLARCLEHILRGDLVPDRVVVSDQSASPDTRRIVETMTAGGAPIRYIHLPEPAASRARNTGFHVAGTDLVAFIDDDCVADPGWLRALVRTFERSVHGAPVVAVTGAVLPLAGSPGPVPVSSRTSVTPRSFMAAEGGLRRGAWGPWDVGTGANILTARSALLAVGGFDESLGPGTAARAAEDIDLLYRLARTGTLVYEPAAVVRHPAGTRRQRLRSRRIYGRGMGVMLERYLRAGSRDAAPITSLYLRHQAAQALRTGRWGPLEAALLLSAALPPILRGALARRPRGRRSRPEPTP